MISFSSSSLALDQANHKLRRSDRKRTKRIFKQDLVDRNSIRHRTGKKHRSMKTNENIQMSFSVQPCQLPLPVNLFQFNTVQSSVQALRQMKEAVNRQQIKYEKLLEIKLIAQSHKAKQNSRLNREGNYLCSTENNESYTEQSDRIVEDENSQIVDCERDLVRMATGTDQMYLQFQCLRMESSDPDSGHSEFNIEYPELGFTGQPLSCRRKQSAIMLSDNYQNDQLIYNMEQLQPQWLREQYIQNVDW